MSRTRLAPISRVLKFNQIPPSALDESHRFQISRGEFVSFGEHWRCKYCHGSQTAKTCEDWAQLCALSREQNSKSLAWPSVATTKDRFRNPEE